MLQASMEGLELLADKTARSIRQMVLLHHQYFKYLDTSRIFEEYINAVGFGMERSRSSVE